MHRKTTNPKAVAGLAVLAFMVGGAATVADSKPAKTDRVCFPAKKWQADLSKRPCAQIVRVYEDGSVKVRVTDAAGRFRYVAGVGALDR